MNQEMQYDEAIRLANEIKAHVPESDQLEIFWERPESKEALELVQAAGYSPNEFIDDVNLELEFNASDFAKRFYQSYKRQISSALCNKDSDLRQGAKNAINAGTGSLIALLVAELCIPVGAAMLIAPIAASLLVKGIDAFCEIEAQ